jgi:large conductance mechanosensitive channel
LVRRKAGVISRWESFAEAATVLDDDFALTREDPAWKANKRQRVRYEFAGHRRRHRWQPSSCTLPTHRSARRPYPSTRINEEGAGMLKGFREFVLRGNVVDLAVAVVIGGAFGAVVAAFVKDLLTPLIAAIAGKPDFSALTFTVNNSKFLYGDFINALLSFLLVAAAVYFFVVVPMRAWTARFARPGPPPATRPCPECLSEMPVAARRCAHCTAVVATPAR